ncbi:hypothetical protein T492DRAFT_868199 [Pavlovales sp. CCMP2436]|nr:hypothetical protein T492DRAFT_868199 [Pavlovales sp. CCMP2436]
MLASGNAPASPSLPLSALLWLALPLPAESADSARTRLAQALVHANALTCALVEAGQLADDEAEGRVNNLVAEFYSWAAYVEGLAAYHRWWAFAASERDPALTQAASDQAVSALENALRAPKGWHEDHHDGGVPATGAGAGAGGLDEDASVARQAQLNRLKAQCVPQMCELVHSALLQTARLDSSPAYATRALQWVTELVADDHYRLYAHFTPQRMRTLLGLLRKSALVVFELQAN